MIELKNFSIGFGERVLIGRCNQIFPGASITALIGRNGTGKSTLMRAISGLNSRFTGDILLGGESVIGMSAVERARKLSLVTTERTRIPAMTCRRIVGMGRSPYTDWMGTLSDKDYEIVDKALADINMSEYANRTLDTMSDGECQRIMIARAIAQDTPVILLDEPTSFLDLPSRYSLVMLLSRLAHEKNKCIVFSTHELDIALNLTDFVAMLADNTIDVRPSPEMRNSGIVREKFDIPDQSSSSSWW